jgi:excisionase family DNA binding protein
MSTSPSFTVSSATSLPASLLRADQVAEVLNVRPSWVYDAVRTGSLPCVRVGRHIRFTREMLATWLAAQTESG